MISPRSKASWYLGRVADQLRHFYYSNQWQVLEERIDTATTADQQFVWGLRYVDDLILRDKGSDRLYSLQDALFNVVALADTTGTVKERFAYQPYGASEELNPDFTTYNGTEYNWEYRFTGRELDLDTGLQLNRNRYYHNQLGRWLSRDPIGYAGGDLNLYEYVSNCPTVFRDPLGLSPVRTYEECMAIVRSLYEEGTREFELAEKECRRAFPAPLDPFGIEAVGGVCGSVNWNVTTTIANVDYWGSGPAIRLAINTFLIPPPAFGNRMSECSKGFKCCPIQSVHVNIDFRLEGILKDVDIPGPFSPDPLVEIGITGFLNAMTGICVKDTCKCPEPLADRTINIKGKFDFGEIDYAKLVRELKDLGITQ